MSLANYAETQNARLTISVLEDLVEQQRIANVIALARLAQDRFGNHAGEAGGIGTLFSYGETPESNMRVRDEIAYALGIRQWSIQQADPTPDERSINNARKGAH